jgi:DNA-binding protein HU-beta
LHEATPSRKASPKGGLRDREPPAGRGKQPTAGQLTQTKSAIYTFNLAGIRIPLNFSSSFAKGGCKVNKNELVSVVAAKAGLSKSDAAKAVDAVFDGIEAALKKHGEFRNVGFGTFHVVKRAASVGRNPRTGEEINIPASKQVKFKAGAGLKASVN